MTPEPTVTQLPDCGDERLTKPPHNTYCMKKSMYFIPTFPKSAVSVIEEQGTVL